MQTVYIILGIIGLFILFIFGNWLVVFNIKQQTKRAWKEFEEQFFKKIAVATEIIKEVMKYAAYNKDLVNEIIKAKNKAEGAKTFEEKKEAGNLLSIVLKSVFAVSEKYPDLKTSAKFMELKKELEEIEEGIDSAKKIYGDSLESLKTIISKKPFAKIISFFTKKNEAPVDEKPKKGKVKVNKKYKNNK